MPPIEWYQIVLPMLMGMIAAGIGAYLGVKVGQARLEERMKGLEKSMSGEVSYLRERLGRLEDRVFGLPPIKRHREETS